MGTAADRSVDQRHFLGGFGARILRAILGAGFLSSGAGKALSIFLNSNGFLNGCPILQHVSGDLSHPSRFLEASDTFFRRARAMVSTSELCTKLSQDTLNIVNKTRSNPLPWRGQFSPQLVEALLRAYSSGHVVVLDPFVGSGTVLYECSRLGTTGLGCEINPAAATLARIYQLALLPLADRRSLMESLREKLHHLLVTETPLFNSGEGRDGRNILLHTRTNTTNLWERMVLDAFICVADFYKGPILSDTARSVWQRLRDLILTLNYAHHPIEVALCDARVVPLPGKYVDLIITSPPYINVFNYHQQYRASMEALGWDILSVAGSEIGSNRKHRGNRLLTVVQYCIDMALFLAEMRRVAKDSARMVMIVGRESNVRKTAFYNGEIIGEIAASLSGFRLILRQERVFKNKFGIDIYEDVLHFAVAKEEGDRERAELCGRRLALDVLREASKRAPSETKGDFEDAIENATEVKPSPIFQAHFLNGESPIQSSFTVFDRSRI